MHNLQMLHKTHCWPSSASVALISETICYLSFIVAAWGLLGGWDKTDQVWLAFPNCLAYLIPLLIPFTTYVVITRWAGEEMYRYS